MINHAPLNRRHVLAGAAALGATTLQAALLPGTARAAADPVAGRSGAGTHAHLTTRDGGPVTSRSVGAFEVLALRDAAGSFFLTQDVAFPNADPGDWARARRIDPGAFGPDGTWNLDFRCYAIRRPDGRILLVDTGVGPVESPAAAWAPVPGHLPELLVTAGIEVTDVDTVVLTHLHEDHAGWSALPGGTPMFPNARYVVQQTELDALVAGGDEAILSYVVEPLRRTGQLQPVDGSVQLVGSVSGAPHGRTGRAGGRISVVPSPGHTPGHQSVLVECDDEQLIVTGDVLVHAVQIADPDVVYRYESDQELARLTRRTLLDQARQSRATLATAHLTQPFVQT